ncbi:hypothetical protein KQX54_011302 [Cotesia glomerata]|uniref:Uncharacterized protein n=1 Tax=Cotesia glomerata TaxID=32391 RepID=A0AAV7J2A8_COTGL|nr:hypothetical protein KQX54_011302 [Cotesia glomerata]
MNSLNLQLGHSELFGACEPARANGKVRAGNWRYIGIRNQPSPCLSGTSERCALWLLQLGEIVLSAPLSAPIHQQKHQLTRE